MSQKLHQPRVNYKYLSLGKLVLDTLDYYTRTIQEWLYYLCTKVCLYAMLNAVVSVLCMIYTVCKHSISDSIIVCCGKYGTVRTACMYVYRVGHYVIVMVMYSLSVDTLSYMELKKSVIEKIE